MIKDTTKRKEIKFKKVKVKHLKLSTEKKKAWKVFSLFIRRSYAAPNGQVLCYTCDNPYEWKNIQAGHAIGGRNASILFNEDLVRPQCVGCNVFRRGSYARFTRKLIDELGIERYDELSALATQVVQLKAIDYVDIAQMYKDRLETLLQNE